FRIIVFHLLDYLVPNFFTIEILNSFSAIDIIRLYISNWSFKSSFSFSRFLEVSFCDFAINPNSTLDLQLVSTYPNLRSQYNISTNTILHPASNTKASISNKHQFPL